MALIIAFSMVALITFFPSIFKKMLGAGGVFKGREVPGWMLYNDKEMSFLLSWRFRIYVLICGALLFYIEHQRGD